MVDLAARELLPEVKRALGRPEAREHEALSRALPMLAGVGGRSDRRLGAAAAVFYVAIFGHVLRELFPEARFGAARATWRFAWFGLSRILTAPTSPWFPGDDEKDAMLRRRVRARGGLVRGADGAATRRAWTWGALHEFAPRHPLACARDVRGRRAGCMAGAGLAVHRAAASRGRRAEPPYPVVAVTGRAHGGGSLDRRGPPGPADGRVGSRREPAPGRSARGLAHRRQHHGASCGTDTTGDITELVPG